MRRPLVVSFALVLAVCVAIPLLRFALADSRSALELTDDGYAALGRGDLPEAKTTFERALEKLTPSDLQFVRAKMGLVEAWTPVDGKRASALFLELAEQCPDAVGAKEFLAVAKRLTDAKQFQAAIEVLTRWRELHPESATDTRFLIAIEDLGHAAERAGAPDAVEALKSLGYVGLK